MKSSFPPAAYEINFLKERGYVRRRCKRCGEYFWTLDPDRDVCGESPCVPYSFIGRSLTKARFSFKDVKEIFLRFFEKRGHEVIAPYPVVARWRDDLFLVPASIADFQPHVTSGISPPPANPLVIIQPCIRLEDVDKVGLTFGRHLTCFSMGGHHAFNYPDKEVYWKEKTVEYYHEFITGEFGIPEEEVIYKEAIWSGGGNAGPCLETISYGLELATLVFMQYKTVNDELIELPIRTVDTGYGMERFAWLSQGTPSCFDAVYGELYPRLEKLIGFPRVERSILEKYSPYTALVVPKAEIRIMDIRRRISELSGIPLDVIIEEIEPLEKIYALLDFTKSMAFIMSEGVVPSNVRVGYLARLLIRRTYRLLMSMGHEDKLLDLLDLQLDYWGKEYPNLREMRDEVLDLVETEVEKFRETISKGSSYVERELSSMKRSGIVEVPADFMIKVYDERGITPDIVESIAERVGMRARAPENFYSLVASRHLSAQRIEVERDRMKLLEEVFKDLPATEQTYYEKPFESRFTAKVLGVHGEYIVLDKTLFYPEGGGAVSDTGRIRHSKGECRVLDVQLLSGGVIVHRVDGQLPEIGEEVEGLVDLERRYAVMRHHTATHILIGAARRVFGKHAWQAGARKEPSHGRLDISHHKRLTLEDIKRLEDEANRIVRMRIPLRIMWMDRNEAERRYGFSLYQGGEVPSAKIRVVEIPGWDAEACCGLHVENTEDVGFIKILKTERIQEGVERLIFAAGPAALPHIQEDWRLIRSFTEKLGAPREAVEKRLDEILAEVRELRKTVRRLTSLVAKAKAMELRSSPIQVQGIKLYIVHEPEHDREYVLTIADELLKVGEPSCLIASYGEKRPSLLILANKGARESGVHAGRLASAIASNFMGKGGGNERLGQGGFGRQIAYDDLRDVAVAEFKKLLGSR